MKKKYLTFCGILTIARNYNFRFSINISIKSFMIDISIPFISIYFMLKKTRPFFLESKYRINFYLRDKTNINKKILKLFKIKNIYGKKM